MHFGFKVLEQLWAQENDISNLETLKLIANDLKINFEDLSKLAMSDKIKKIYETNTQEAINMNIYLEFQLIFIIMKCFGVRTD